MELKFKNPGIDYMLHNIMEFQTEETTDFWSEPLYFFYPKLDKAYAAGLPFKEKKAYIEKILCEIYEEEKTKIDEKASLYSEYWEKCKPQIIAALSEAFDIDCGKIFNDMVGNVSLNPIDPRFLESNSFDIFYLNSEKGAIGEAIHEIIHFCWFYVWNEIFKDSYNEYESPSLKWILSEMVVESIMSDERLASINPYFPREQGGCIYPYFFDMKANGEYVLDVIDGLYRNNSIEDFMKKSYSYVLENEQEIRKHIEESENK